MPNTQYKIHDANEFHFVTVGSLRKGLENAPDLQQCHGVCWATESHHESCQYRTPDWKFAIQEATKKIHNTKGLVSAIAADDTDPLWAASSLLTDPISVNKSGDFFFNGRHRVVAMLDQELEDCLIPVIYPTK